MKLTAAILATSLALAPAPAGAAATFDYLFDEGYPLATSTDGSVLAGNLADGSFGPFRWTEAGGLEPLGRRAFVGGGGMPGMSADGTVIASTIGSLDSSYSTQGRWTLEGGWQELMPPIPADGGETDGSYGSIWGLSGDGATAVGLYWRSGFGRAHASRWTQATGVVDLGGTPNERSSRANGVNYDGTVIVGWQETPLGPWRPAAWVNGVHTLLTDVDLTTNAGTGEARVVSANGDYIAGFSADPVSGQRAAARWTRTAGVFGPTEILGWIDGSEPGYGKTIPYGVTNDGSMVIGYATYAGDPFDVAGFVWTPETGVVDAAQFLANQGVFLDPNFQIKSLSAITPDGTKIFGFGQMLTPPYTEKAFRITLPGVTSAPSGDTPAGLAMAAPTPNPAHGSTRLEFTLATPARAELTVFDATGRRVRTLLAGELPAGRSSATWDGRDEAGRSVPAGLYFARLATPEGAVSRRILRVN